MSDAAMNTAQAKIQKQLLRIGEDACARGAIDLSQENIKNIYPVLSTSLFNLLQNAENKIGARKK